MTSRVTVFLRVILAIVFLWAGIGKLLDLDAFAYDLKNFPGVPPWSAEWIAAILPWIEIATAGLLLTRWWRLGALLASYLVMLFIVLLAVAWIMGRDVQCGCFGALGSTSLPWALARNAILLCASTACYCLAPSKVSGPPAKTSPKKSE